MEKKKELKHRVYFYAIDIIKLIDSFIVLTNFLE